MIISHIHTQAALAEADCARCLDRARAINDAGDAAMKVKAREKHREGLEVRGSGSS